MIGLDTNVIVRYLVRDDPAQSARAAAIFEKAITENNPGFVSVVVLVEMVWVLERGYGFERREIARAIETLLATESLVVDAEAAVFEAMVALKNGRGSFADSLIGALGRAAGCTHTVTFDRRAARFADFVAI